MNTSLLVNEEVFASNAASQHATERDQNTLGPFAHRSDSERRLELAFTFQIAHSSDSCWQETAGSLEGDFGCCVKCLMHPLEPCNRRGCRTWKRHVRSTRDFLFHWEDKKCAKTKHFATGDFSSYSHFQKDQNDQYPLTFFIHKLFGQLLTR